MPFDHRERLRKIRRFDQLVAYLRDELDWPIEGDHFDNLTFDWEADELGLDMKTAAKIQQIKQLRPFTTDQPFGIFFVKFEKKRLPVVALRRILGRLVIKKRASAQRSDVASWDMHDLLFISSYGDEDDRRISLAHFTDSDHMGNLPSLRVVGFSEGDRDLKIDYNHNELRTKLRWPHDESQFDRWRKDWRSAFMLKHGEVISTSKQLAVKLAELAREIRKHVNEILEIESEDGPIRKLMAAFREALIHDLEEDDFADMYAQTIAYGLLSARVSRSEGLVADDLVHMIPITNPFLKELMETFLDVGGKKKRSAAALDFDELGINEVVELLREANMEAVLRDFDSRNPREDPVIHFYELFLKEYDAKKRMQRGVFYTPKPVVSFIVRSVDGILRTEFGLQDGLADTTTWGEFVERNKDVEIPDGVSPDAPFVQILDPATGTGTFLVEVIDVIHARMTQKWRTAGHSAKEIVDLWNDYVPRHLLPRLYGFELLMAPYAIAHMKIGLRLAETGYRFGCAERARVYLTNSLEPASDFSGVFAEMVPALAHEAAAAKETKIGSKPTVIVGNPPYSKISANLTPEMRATVERYRYLDGEKIKERGALQFEINLQDDYVKFCRFCENQLSRSEIGVLGLITNNGYLSTPTLRGMRDSLLETFDDIRIVDLHGHLAKGERGPDGRPEGNVFDILQGVCINLAAKRHRSAHDASVKSFDCYGTAEEKYEFLLQHTFEKVRFSHLSPKFPFYTFVPRDGLLAEEWRFAIPINELFPKNSAGIITARDGLVLAFDRCDLEKRIERFANSRSDDPTVYERFGFSPSKRFNLKESLVDLRKLKSFSDPIRRILHRPFDHRSLFFHPSVVWSMSRPMANAMKDGNNLALLATRQVTRPSFEHAFVSRHMIEIKVCSHDRNTQIFPLFVNPSASDAHFGAKRRPNLSASAIQRFPNVARNLAVPEILHFVYSLLYSPAYRTRYFEFLKSEFPRILVPLEGLLLNQLAALGADIVALHLLEDDYEHASWNRENKPSPLANAAVLFPFVGKGDREVTKAGEAKKKMANVADGKGRVYINRTQYFDNVPEDVWNFHIGGYQACHKWLSDRKARGGKNPRPGRVLSDDDILHYQRIVVALKETIRLMAEIDEVIDKHGGWPDAFVTEPIEDEPAPETERPFP